MRSIYTLAIVAALVGTVLPSKVQAQTVRFETSVGDFDMVLNPTNNPNLQPLVDNIIAYVGLGRYHYSAINRAADNDNTDASDDFVLQMGGFMGFPRTPNLWPQLMNPVESLDAVVVDGDGDGNVDFDTTGLTNTRGTISLALSAGNVNSGTSSFFINLGDNASLDAQGFVPFAQVEDMTTIDFILQLMQNDLSAQAGSPGSLAFIDVPLTEDGKIVVVERVSVVEADDNFSFVGPIAAALNAPNQEVLGGDIGTQELFEMLADSGSGSSAAFSAAANRSAVTSTPEPSAAMLLAAALPALLARRSRRKAIAA